MDEKKFLSYRIEAIRDAKMEKIVQERITNLKSKKAVKIHGMTSTSLSMNAMVNFQKEYEEDEDELASPLSITILLQDSKNPLGKNLKFSKFSYEKELLLPHGVQLYYFHHIENDSAHIFFAKPVFSAMQEIYSKTTENEITKKFDEDQKKLENSLVSKLTNGRNIRLIQRKNDGSYKLVQSDFRDKSGNNILHFFANASFFPQDCFKYFQKNLFFFLLIQKNNFNVTPLETFIKLAPEGSKKTIAWLNENIKNIKGRPRYEYKLFIKNLFFSAISQGDYFATMLMVNFRIEFLNFRENPVHRSINCLTNNFGEYKDREKLCLDLIQISPKKWINYADEKGFTPYQLSLSQPQVNKLLLNYDCRKYISFQLFNLNSKKRRFEELLDNTYSTLKPSQ